MKTIVSVFVMILLVNANCQQFYDKIRSFVQDDWEKKFLEKDRVYETTNPIDGSIRHMSVRKFYDEADPFSELFRTFNTVHDNLMKMVSSFDLPESDNTTMEPSFIRIPSIDNLQKRLNMSCKPTVQEGKWYRFESVECTSNRDDSNLLQMLMTSSPQPTEGEIIKEQEQGFNKTTLPMTESQELEVKSLFDSERPNGHPIMWICIIGLCIIVVSVIILFFVGRRANQVDISNNRIIVSREDKEVPNYGSF